MSFAISLISLVVIPILLFIVNARSKQRNKRIYTRYDGLPVFTRTRTVSANEMKNREPYADVAVNIYLEDFLKVGDKVFVKKPECFYWFELTDKEFVLTEIRMRFSISRVFYMSLKREEYNKWKRCVEGVTVCWYTKGYKIYTKSKELDFVPHYLDLNTSEVNSYIILEKVMPNGERMDIEEWYDDKMRRIREVSKACNDAGYGHLSTRDIEASLHRRNLSEEEGGDVLIVPDGPLGVWLIIE